MSLHIVIDAYNLIRRTSRLQEASPKSLINFIVNQNFQGSIKNRITLVFDGYPKIDFRMGKHPNLEIIFSRDLSADEVIKNILKSASGDKSLMVVSDDREIIDKAKVERIKSISTTYFINKGKEPKPPKKDDSADGKRMSYTEMRAINKELEKIWLKKDEKSK